eukprot:3793123-Amphidinium_carterae.2
MALMLVTTVHRRPQSKVGRTSHVFELWRHLTQKYELKLGSRSAFSLVQILTWEFDLVYLHVSLGRGKQSSNA